MSSRGSLLRYEALAKELNALYDDNRRLEQRIGYCRQLECDERAGSRLSAALEGLVGRMRSRRQGLVEQVAYNEQRVDSQGQLTARLMEAGKGKRARLEELKVKQVEASMSWGGDFQEMRQTVKDMSDYVKTLREEGDKQRHQYLMQKELDLRQECELQCFEEARRMARELFGQDEEVARLLALVDDRKSRLPI